MSKNKKSPERFKKIEKNGTTAYSNATSLFGKEGTKLVEDVMDAFNKAMDVTKKELKENNTVKSVADRLTDRLAGLSLKDIDAVTDFITDYIFRPSCTTDDDTDKEGKAEECTCQCDKKACDCGNNKCGNKCCKCDISKEADDNMTDCGADAKSHDDTIYDSTQFVEMRHQAYLDSLYDGKKLHVETPLPAALKRTAYQALDLYNQKHCGKPTSLLDDMSALETDFVTYIVTRLFNIIDRDFPVDNSGNLDLAGCKGYRFSGIENDDEPFGVVLCLDMDTMEFEIRQRLADNSDNGRLLQLIALHTGFAIEHIGCVYKPSTNVVELTFDFLDDYDDIDDYDGVEEY